MDMREYVEYLLKNYHGIKSEIELLRLELSHFKGITPEETIDTMTFSQPESERVQTSGPSDKTSKIAIAYRLAAEKINRGSFREIEEQIRANEFALLRLEYCMNCLERKMKGVIVGVYIERRSWGEICKELFMTEKTLNKYRNKAIEEIAVMIEHKRLVV